MLVSDKTKQRKESTIVRSTIHGLVEPNDARWTLHCIHDNTHRFSITFISMITKSTPIMMSQCSNYLGHLPLHSTPKIIHVNKNAYKYICVLNIRNSPLISTHTCRVWAHPNQALRCSSSASALSIASAPSNSWTAIWTPNPPSAASEVAQVGA